MTDHHHDRCPECGIGSGLHRLSCSTEEGQRQLAGLLEKSFDKSHRVIEKLSNRPNKESKMNESIINIEESKKIEKNTIFRQEIESILICLAQAGHGCPDVTTAEKITVALKRNNWTRY